MATQRISYDEVKSIIRNALSEQAIQQGLEQYVGKELREMGDPEFGIRVIGVHGGKLIAIDIEWDTGEKLPRFMNARNFDPWLASQPRPERLLSKEDIERYYDRYSMRSSK